MSRNITQNYNTSYKTIDSPDGEGGSAYRNKFGKKPLATKEVSLIKEVVSLAVKKNEQLWLKQRSRGEVPCITLLDFGCGDGRFLDVFQEIADDLSTQGVNLRVIGYEISDGGLNEYRTKLLDRRFFEERKSEQSVVLPREITNLSKANLEISLLCGAPDLKLKKIQEKIGNIDISLCMFGTLSHILDPNERREILTLFSTIADYSALTIPSRNIFIEEQKAYDLLRKQRHPAVVGKLDHLGDIEYIAKGSENSSVPVVNPYHLFTEQEALELIEKSRLDLVRFGINAINNPIKLTKNPILDKIDSLASDAANKLLPNLVDFSSSYFEFIASSHRLREIGTSKPPTTLKPKKLPDIEMVPLGRSKAGGGRAVDE